MHPSDMTDPKQPSPKEALSKAKWLYDELALSPLVAAAKHGSDYEPPTDEQCLEVQGMIKAAIPVAELEHQAVEWLIREFEAQPFSFIKFLGEDKVRELAKILEALKAKEE